MTDIKVLCDMALANPNFRPKNGQTFCNLAVNFIAHQMGCSEFDGLMADGIYNNISANVSGKWKKVDPSDATILALSNGLSIAAMPSDRLSEKHGHVCVVYPLGMQNSASFGHDVPMIANVGKTVGVMKSSAVFPVSKGEPDYFTFAG